MKKRPPSTPKSSHRLLFLLFFKYLNEWTCREYAILNSFAKTADEYARTTLVRVMQAWIFNVFYIDFLLIPAEKAGTLAQAFWLAFEKVILLAKGSHSNKENPFSGLRFTHPRTALCPAWINNTMVLATQGKLYLPLDMGIENVSFCLRHSMGF